MKKSRYMGAGGLGLPRDIIIGERKVILVVNYDGGDLPVILHDKRIFMKAIVKSM